MGFLAIEENFQPSFELLSSPRSLEEKHIDNHSGKKFLGWLK
jgi:hypothetical protein